MVDITSVLQDSLNSSRLSPLYDSTMLGVSFSKMPLIVIELHSEFSSSNINSAIASVTTMVILLERVWSFDYLQLTVSLIHRRIFAGCAIQCQVPKKREGILKPPYFQVRHFLAFYTEYE